MSSTSLHILTNRNQGRVKETLFHWSNLKLSFAFILFEQKRDVAEILLNPISSVLIVFLKEENFFEGIIAVILASLNQLN